MRGTEQNVRVTANEHDVTLWDQRNELSGMYSWLLMFQSLPEMFN